ncbi:twin-arginine translocase TatA/TatE family subunit [Deinococcus deserti]|uniref:Sec-independent protein translocase protein TatA n=1 Tax=Deinococcus deserti (strain DSM 17065 / CIP 109153 / LMG 22923 / VCD115) TaxID=546414 RepID=TATA_DEIDV|nr:twin-arginine translocase TatA/TatE family subunit [Deinococcus deserti]C1D186.1 RecName: Full=Sec-independent protein translocase protein TatA [Deinococcus deserti VCD115]ACO45610.1 putative Twin-arginine translocation protein, TatA/E family [Deinococcus deserti VCD115]
MLGFGPFELILIVVIIALLFGARKLPELGKGMGRGIKEFKQEMHEPSPPRPQVTDIPSQRLDPVTGAPVSTESTVPASDRRS